MGTRTFGAWHPHNGQIQETVLLSCGEHLVHVGSCTECVAMETIFGDDRDSPCLRTPSGDTVRLRGNSDALEAVIEPRGCPGAICSPLCAVLSPRIRDGAADAGLARAHVVPCTDPAQPAVVYVGSLGLPGGGQSFSLHKCSEDAYKCRNCPFECPLGRCPECCTHKNHICSEHQRKNETTKAKDKESLITEEVKKAQDLMDELLTNMKVGEDSFSESQECQFESSKLLNEEVDGSDSENEFEVVANETIYIPSNITKRGFLPITNRQSYNILTVPQWNDPPRVSDNAESFDFEICEENEEEINELEIVLFRKIVYKGFNRETLSTEKFFTLWSDVISNYIDERERIAILKWCLYHKLKSAQSLASVCDLLILLILTDDVDILSMCVQEDAFSSLKKMWLEQKNKFGNFLPEENSKIREAVSLTNWGPEVCELFEDFSTTMNCKQVIDLISYVKSHNVPDAILLLAMTHSSEESSVNKYETCKNIILTHVLFKCTKFDNVTITRISSLLFKLIEMSYSLDLLRTMLNENVAGITRHIDEFINTIEIIVNFQIGSTLGEEVIKKNCLKGNVNEWPKRVDKYIIKSIFKASKIRTIDELMALITDLDEDTRNNLRKEYESIYATYKKFVDIHTEDEELKKSEFLNRPICQWDKKHISQWAVLIRKKIIEEHLNETVAVLMQAVKLHCKFLPRSTQILALLMLLRPKADHGRLVQMNTGEGKSMLIAMLSAVHALRGKYVDVVTTACDLAEREARKWRDFFKMLTLSVSENTTCKGIIESVERSYSCNVVFGTARNFIGDILYHQYLGQKVRGKREFHVVLVDEADSKMFDRRSMSVRLAQNIPAITHLQPLFGVIWQHMNHCAATLVHSSNGKVYQTLDPKDIERLKTNPDQNDVEITDPRQYMINQTQTHASKLIRELSDIDRQNYRHFLAVSNQIFKIKLEDSNNGKQENENTYAGDNSRTDAEVQSPEVNEDTEKSPIEILKETLDNLPWVKGNHYDVLEIPQHLRTFALKQIPCWVKNAFNAMTVYKKDAHYTVKNGSIVPIFYDDNGELQTSLVWCDALTLFLQIKEGLPADAETISTNFLSGIAFLYYYGSNIFGVTGTLGGKETKDFLRKTFRVDFATVPPFSYAPILHNKESPYHCKELRPLILHRREEWFEHVVSHALYHAEMNRAVLVICRFMKQAREFAQELRRRCRNPMGHFEDKVAVYDGKEDYSKFKLESGDIVVATNIAGRGTDFELSDCVNLNGGLYVCGSFMPNSWRSELQNMGRTARQGQKGLGQLILLSETGDDLATLRQKRKQREAIACHRALMDVERVCLNDRLFEVFVALERRLLPSEQTSDLQNEWISLKGDWEAYLQRNSTSLAAQLLEKKQRILDDLRWEVSRRPVRSEQANTIASDIEKRFEKNFEAKIPELNVKLREILLQKFCKVNANRYSVILLDCLQKGNEYEPATSDLARKNEWGHFEKRALEERWALWLRAKRFDHNTDVKSAVQQFTEEFETKINDDANKNTIIQNPWYYVLKGNMYYTHAMKLPKIAFIQKYKYLNKAKDCYDKAIELDSVFSSHAHYNKACALLSRDRNANIRNQATSELLEAKEIIQNTLRPNLVLLCSLFSATGTKVGTVQHIQHQLNILSQEEHFIDKALSVLAEAEMNNCHVTLSTIPLPQVFKTTDELFLRAVNEAVSDGLPHFFSIQVLPPIAWLSVFALALIGITQIIVGSLMTVCSVGFFGPSLVLEGVSDCVLAITSTWTGSVQWGQWAIAKICSMTLLMFTSSFRAIKYGYDLLKAATKTLTVEKCIVGAKTAIHSIISYIKGNSIIAESISEIENHCRDRDNWENIEDILSRTIESKIRNLISNNDFFKTAIELDENNQSNYWKDILGREAMALYDTSHYGDGENLQIQLLGHFKNTEGDVPQLPDDLRGKIHSFVDKFAQDFISVASSKFGSDVTRLRELQKKSNTSRIGDRRIEVFQDPISEIPTEEGEGAPGSDTQEVPTTDTLSRRVAVVVTSRIWHTAHQKLSTILKSRQNEKLNTEEILKSCGKFAKEQQRLWTGPEFPAPQSPKREPEFPQCDSRQTNCQQPKTQPPEIQQEVREAFLKLSYGSCLSSAWVHILAKVVRRPVVVVEAKSGRMVLRVDVDASCRTGCEAPVALRVTGSNYMPLGDDNFQPPNSGSSFLHAAVAAAGSDFANKIGGIEGLRAAMAEVVVQDPKTATRLFKQREHESSETNRIL